VYKSQKDFFAGLMFIVIGLAFAIGAYEYPMGDSSKMGPGYFPKVLGYILAALGCLVMYFSFTSKAPDGDRIGAWAWRPLGWILLANFVFGALLGGLKMGSSVVVPQMGLVVAIYALVLIASRAAKEYKFWPSLVSATVLALGCYLVFPVLLKLQLPVWPAFLSN
jgi:Tripartite tricarboxylate transporter TctB family